MSNAPKFRKKAVEFEQLKQFDRAIASYVRAIEENENAGEDVDVALFNKVGDLTLRSGRVTDAVTYYERAVEHYVTNSLYDNAIALCNKILRNAPGRSNVYFTLGRICGRKGLRSDATRNFLEFATRMQQEGRVDEGMRALAEIVDLMPELTEVGRLVEEHATRAGISLRHRSTPARNAAQPAPEPQKTLFGLSKNLVFLDIDYDEPKTTQAKTPVKGRGVELARTPPGVSLFDGVADAPPVSTDVADRLIFDPFADLEGEADGADAGTVSNESILKPYVDPSTPLPALSGLEPTEFEHTPSQLEAIASAETIVDFLHRGVAAESPASPTDEQALASDEILDHVVDDLEFEEFAPSNDDLSHARFERVEPGSLPLVADAYRASDELPPLIFPLPSALEPSSVRPVDELARPDDSKYDLAFENSFDDGSNTAFDAALDEAFDATAEQPYDAAQDATLDLAFGTTLDASYDATFDPAYDSTYDASAEPKIDLPFLSPSEIENVVFIDDVDSELDGEIDSGNANDFEDLFEDPPLPTATVAAVAALAARSRRDELQDAVGVEPTNWTTRRRLAEALFEAGERDGAIAELSIALSGCQRDELFADAAEIADELVRVAGEDVSHHQKRLELAIRMSDQSRLRDAYLDLADMLVRRNEDLRAKAVYARVLEIDPWDERARTALGDAAPPLPARPNTALDSEQVDLAEWLRDDDEPGSTRLRMREPAPTGNEQDDFNALLRQFKEGVARSLGEDDYDSHYDLGVAYKEMGLLDDAIGEFQKALRSRTYRLAAYEALGQCFLEQQSYKVAVTVLSRALHEPAFQDEQRVGVLYLLGLSCEALQRFDEARSYFQRVYATDINFRDVGQRLADLERITR